MAEKKNTVSKRLDSNRIKLRKGESQRKNGTYDYRWTTPDENATPYMPPHLMNSVKKEEEIISDKRDGIRVENKRITVNHTLVYYNKGGSKHCHFAVNTPKTAAGTRTIPMMDFVRDAFLQEKQYQGNAGCAWPQGHYNHDEHL